MGVIEPQQPHEPPIIGIRPADRCSRRKSLQQSRHRRDRSHLCDHPSGVGGLRRRRERNQPRRARRRSRIAIHSNGVLRPHFGVLRLSDRDRRRVLTEKIGRNQRHHQNPIRRNHRRRHRHHKSGLISRRGRRGLHPRLLGPRRGLAQPGHIRRGRRHHRQRRRSPAVTPRSPTSPPSPHTIALAIRMSPDEHCHQTWPTRRALGIEKAPNIAPLVDNGVAAQLLHRKHIRLQYRPPAPMTPNIHSS